MDAIKEVEPGVYEGLMTPYGGPANGRDLTGTYFAAKGDPSWPAGTDFCLDWNPGGVYPLLYGHGLHPEVKASVVGRWSFKSWDERGGWAKIELEKANKYNAEIKELVEEGKLKLSSGAVDHLYQSDDKTGAIKLWPLVEGSLTPIPANPDQPPVGYAVKSLDAEEHLAVLGVAMPKLQSISDVSEDAAIRAKVGPPEGGKKREDIPDEDFAGPNKTYPIVTQASVGDAASLIGKADNPDEVKAKIIAIAKRKGFESSLPKAWTEDAEKSLPKVTSFDAVADQRLTAVKAGARNNSTDQTHLNQAHQAAHDTMAHTLAAGAACETCNPDSSGEPDADDAGKSLDVQPVTGLAVKTGTDAVRMSDADLAKFRESIKEAAITVGIATAQQILRP